MKKITAIKTDFHPQTLPGRKLIGTWKIRMVVRRVTLPVRAIASALVFFLKVFPMLPSRPVDWVTRTPVIKKVEYRSQSGLVAGDIYLPGTGGRHPAVMLCLGVVPFEVEHPQVAVLGKALARAGFAALMYWSPAMRDFRLDPEDLVNLPLAYQWLIEQPYIDPAWSGLFGTCVGGSFALMAAASPLIRDKVSFLGAYAPYTSMWTFARDIASSSRSSTSPAASSEDREPWKVDPLTRKVFAHSLTAWLEPGEAERLRDAFEVEQKPFDSTGLSPDGKAVVSVLSARSAEEADAALRHLPAEMQQRLTIMSPLHYLSDLRVPMMVHLHDAGDQVIPVGESRRLQAAINGQAGVRYTEMNFSHLDPAKGKLPLPRLIREFGKFFLAMVPMFRVGASD